MTSKERDGLAGVSVVVALAGILLVFGGAFGIVIGLGVTLFSAGVLGIAVAVGLALKTDA